MMNTRDLEGRGRATGRTSLGAERRTRALIDTRTVKS